MNKENRGNLTENMKKGLTEYLLLQCLSARPMTIYELVSILDEKSDGICKICYPYASIYRLLGADCIVEVGKCYSDNRKRAYYRITDAGKARLAQMTTEFDRFLVGMGMIADYLKGQRADDKHESTQKIS